MLEKLKNKWHDLIKWSKNNRMPLVKELHLYEVVSVFLKGIVDGNLANRAGSIAYSFFLAIFPGFLFFFTLIPFFPIQGLEAEVFKLLQQVLPPDTYEATRGTISDILGNKRSGLLSFGFISAMFFATNGIRGLIDNFDQTVHALEEKNFWQKIITSLGLTIVVAILFILGVIIIIFSSNVLNSLLSFLNMGVISPFIIETSRFVLLLSLVFFGITVLYNFGSKQGRKWPFFSPGAILATVLIVITSLGFSFYVSNFAQYNKLYGSIGTVMVIMVWIYLNAMVLLIGFELNASISQAKNYSIKSNS